MRGTMRYSKATALFMLLSVIILCGSCATIPEELDADLQQEELFRLAQDAYNAYQYDLALFYYENIVERFSQDRAARIAAEYEIAYIHSRTNKKEEAKEQFETLLAEYQLNPSGFPRWVYVLSRDIYDTLTE